MSFVRLPIDICSLILDLLLQDGNTLANLAAVSRDWQAIIERHNFSHIKLTSQRLANFGSMTDRNKSLVRRIWLCLELEDYDCTACEPQGATLSDADDVVIVTAIQSLFSNLSTWKPAGDLVLDISVYSPSDSEHAFKYLTFEPDVASDRYRWKPHAKQSMPIKAIDHHYQRVANNPNSVPTSNAIDKVFAEIMGEGPFRTDEEEGQWWQQLPLIPAVTGIFLRQQTRRRWKPEALAHLFARLPGLQEIHYEPWREWCNIQQKLTDKYLQLLLESLASNRLRRLLLFENFNQTYPASFTRLFPDGSTRSNCDRVRTASSHVSQAIASTSLELEHLSASFLVDARDFFDARQPSWTWPRMTWLALTSQLLVPEYSAELNIMLEAAAATAMRMPNLETMEIWNGLQGSAMLFRYQRGQPCVITCRGTWEVILHPKVLRAWNAVSHGLLVVNKELLDAASIKSHGGAIRQLKLSRPVIRPVSLRQIELEHAIREQMQN